MHQLSRTPLFRLLATMIITIVLTLLTIQLSEAANATDDCQTEILQYPVYGDISAVYCAYGEQRSSLFGNSKGKEKRFDTKSELTVSELKGYKNNTFQEFQNGIIYNNRQERTSFALFNDILRYYRGRETDLGFPVTSEIGERENCRAYFEKGYIDCTGNSKLWEDVQLEELQKTIYLPQMEMPFSKMEAGATFGAGLHGWNQGGQLLTTISLLEGSGLDISGSFEVLAMASGTVIEVQNGNGCKSNSGLGCWVAIRNDFSGTIIIYGHLVPTTINAQKGYWIKQGVALGKTSANGIRIVGSSTGPHVHIELRDGSKVCKTSQKGCDKYGNPVSWHGTIIDSYLISAYFTPNSINTNGELNNNPTIYNYDGTAIRNALIANNYKYSQDDLRNKLVQCNDTVTTPSGYCFKQIKFDDPYQSYEGNIDRDPYTWMTASAWKTCSNSYSKWCERTNQSYENTVFGLGGIISSNFQADVFSAQSTHGQTGVMTSNGQAQLLSTNEATPYIPRYRKLFPGEENLPIPPENESTSPVQASCDQTQPGVILYSERNYGGLCTRILSSEPDLSNFNLDNAVSSIWINGDYTVKLYKDKYYGEQTGTSHLRDEFSKSDDNIDDKSLGEQWSSIKIEKKRQKSDCGDGNRDGVYFYKDKNYKGTCYYTTSDIRDFGTISVGNNETSSMRIVGDWQVTLYKSQDFRESSKTYTSDKGNLDEKPEIGNNISSARVERLPAACRAPTLLQPTNGTTAGQRTLTFTWAGVVCARANGTDSYRLRIKTVSVMDSGGEVVFDETATGTSRTITLDSRWERRPLYWSVQVANPQNGAAWANAYQFTVDTNLPPAVAIQQANAQPVTADEQYIWGNVSSWNIGGLATDSDGTIARVDVTCAGQSCGATNGAGLNGDRWSYQQDALEGRNHINVQATDNLGAVSQSGNVANITLWVDRQPPQTGLGLNNSANPSDWPAWSTDPVVVHLAASDEGSGSGANLARAGVQEIRYQLNGSEWQSQSGNQLYLELASSGLHTLRYYTVDTVGNVEAERSRQIAIDLTPPPAIGTANEQGGATNDQWQRTHALPVFTWPAVADEHSGLWGYQLYFGEDAAGEGYHTVAADALRQWQPQSTGVTTGVYYLRGRSRDLAGNWSDWSTLFTFRFDNTPPANPERADHAAGVKSTRWQRATSSADFTWLAAVDAGAGLQGYALYWGIDANGESNSVVATNSYQQAAPLCGTGQTCTGYLRLQARDQVGNVAPNWSTAFVLRYDDTPPTLDFNINGGASTANSSQVTLFINGQDSGSGPAQMRFSEDGVTWVTNWITYTTTQPWVINGISGQTTTVHLQIRDGVGLESPVISRSILFDSNIPAPQSANFTLFNSTFAAGSGEQNSATYSLHSTVAEPPDSAPLVSTNYLLLDGYEAGGVAPPAPTPTPTPVTQPTCNAAPILINDSAAFTGSRQVTLRFCANGATEMQVSDNAGFNGAQWEPYAATKTTTLAAPVASVIPLYAYVRFRLADGTVQGAFADAIYFDATQPAPPQIYIGDPVAGIPSAMTIRSAAANAGDSTAVLIGPNDLVGGVTDRDNQSDTMPVQAAGAENGPVIDVYLENQDDMAGIGAVQLSENADFASAEWQAMPSNNVVNWALSANDGEKTLYARVQDKAGNISNADSADFTLDLTSPLGGIELNPYIVGVNTDAVTIYLTAYDNQTGVTDMRISTDPLLLYGDVWRPYTTSLTIPAYLPLAGELSLYVQFRDEVGNVSAVYSDTYQVDVEAPQVSIEVEPGETLTRLLHIYGYDNLSELATMRLSNDLARLAEVEPIGYTTDLSWLFDDRRVVWVQVEDSLGNHTDPIAVYAAEEVVMNSAIYLPLIQR